MRPGELLMEVDGNRTHYWYGDEQRVVRIDIPGDKIIYPQYLLTQDWVNGAGDRLWSGLARHHD
jgi:hypothetical protein